MRPWPPSYSRTVGFHSLCIFAVFGQHTQWGPLVLGPPQLGVVLVTPLRDGPKFTLLLSSPFPFLFSWEGGGRQPG